MIEEFIKKVINLIKNKDYKNALIEIENYPNNKNSFLLYYLAFIKDKLDRKEESLEILNTLTKNNPNFIEAYHLSSNINEDLRKYDVSKNILELLIEKNPNDWKANYNLGRLYQLHLKNKEKALKCYKKALENNQNNNDIWNAVGILQKNLNHYEDAIEIFTDITKKFPENYKNFIQLANMQLSTGLIDMAEESIMKAMELNKDNKKVMNLLGPCYLKQSRLDEAEDIFKKIINYRLYNDEENIAYKRLLISKVYQHDCDHKELIPIFEKYNKDLGRKEKIEKIKFKKNKKIRIGFVSSEFRKHAMNNLINALFVFKDKKNFEYYCYSSYQDEDEITEWYKKNCDSWKDILSLNDQEASSLIRSDNIDVLIFLGGIDGENRYLLSGYKSAPKQVSLHPITSSYNETMDYWISDNELHPINFKEKVSEKIIRIKSHFNFPKPENLPEINEAPMKKNMYISFSSFSNPRKDI